MIRKISLSYFGIPLQKFGGTRELKALIASQRRKLARIGSGAKPLSRGRTQYLLGLALGELGRRGPDTDALRQSAEAFRDALPALRTAGQDSRWAQAQGELAKTLLHLGRHEIGTKSLDEAAEALRLAAEAWEKANDKADWSDVQSRRCAVLTRLGWLEGGTKLLSEAVVAGRVALAAEDNSNFPIADVGFQISLARALACLGERETGTERLEEAVAMARESLQAIVEDEDDILEKNESFDDQLEQSRTLGYALRCLAERRDDTDLLLHAVDVLRSTAALRTDDKGYEWALAQDERARALRLLDERGAGYKLLSESLLASDAALGVLGRDAYPIDWAVATANRANTLAALGERDSDAKALRRAVDDLTAALAVFEKAEAPVQIRQCRDDLERIQALFDRIKRKGAQGGAEDPSPRGPMKPRPA